MAVPKHEKLLELMTDHFWGFNNAQRSLTDPERMRDVVVCICTELRKQPRSVDDAGALAWAADWLETKLEEDEAPA